MTEAAAKPYLRIWHHTTPVPTPEQDAIALQRQREVKRSAARDRWARFLELSGIPERLHGAVLDLARPTPAVQAVQAYLRPEDDFRGSGYELGECLVLAGPTGVGKTYAAAAAMIRLWNGRLWYFGRLAGSLLDPRRRDDALDSCRAESLLVLDDLGTEYVKEGGLVQSFLDEIIWHREGNALPTIITTNLPGDQLADRLGPRIADRIRGPWGRVVECPGASLR
jgi:DNA replication protein DnaC